MKAMLKPAVVEVKQLEAGDEDGYFCYEIMGPYIGFFRKDGPIPRSKRVPAIDLGNAYREMRPGDWVITGGDGLKTKMSDTMFRSLYNILEDN